MKLRRLLLVPQVVRLAAQAPRGVDGRWDNYWATVEHTGDDGDVLWDSSTSDEAEQYLGLLAAHADPGLPIVDVGCGNGRFTRALAARFPAATGLDLSPAAVARARQESAGVANIGFRDLDMTAPGVGASLAAELGPVNVFVRGVLHVLRPPERKRLAANLAGLLGGPDTTMLIAETNYPGSLLGYLESLGARPSGFPAALGRAISTGIPKPTRFGAAELADTFPRDRWYHVHIDHTARIATVPAGGSAASGSVPAIVAVLRSRA
jgi:SAM-dependent methyltransferase